MKKKSIGAFEDMQRAINLYKNAKETWEYYNKHEFKKEIIDKARDDWNKAVIKWEGWING